MNVSRPTLRQAQGERGFLVKPVNSMITGMKSAIEEIYSLAINKELWVAYSGGVDSHVLLHLLATVEHPKLNTIHAIHIDHGLHRDSSKWTQHCVSVAAELGVTLTTIQVEVSDIQQLGLEAAARVARYNAFKQKLTDKAFLLTAQHQQDQAETLLLQLFRGAGPKGLASMAPQFQLDDVCVFRPFLNIKQADIMAYAQQHNLQWIEDPSNIDTRWNRNYIRHNVLPEIEKRWPSAAKTISRSAENCAEANELLTELAQQDLLAITLNHIVDYLPISKILELSPARCRNLLRHFIEQKKMPLPSAAVLHRIIDEVCLAKQDSVPMIRYGNTEIRRFQDKLYFMLPLPEHDVNQVIECCSTTDFKINENSVLTWHKNTGEGLKEQIISAGITIRFRQGGEHIQLAKQQHHKSLKHLFQQWQVPPWQRDRTPLLFSGDRLVAVVGYAVDEQSSVAEGELGYFPRLTSD